MRTTPGTRPDRILHRAPGMRSPRLTHRRLGLLLSAQVLLATSPARAICTPSIQWTWDAASSVGPAWTRLCTTSVVARLTDSNGDSRIDCQDTPDVVLVAALVDDEGLVVVLDGAS